MIEVQNLSKWYGPTRAIDHLNFTIPAGQIVGFLGPNGAGKTTTLRILTGYLPPTSGRATIAGHDVLTQSEDARGKIGYLPENTPLYPEMRVEEYLHYRGKLQQMSRDDRLRRIDIVCERCGLAAVRRRLIGQLSKGNKQRVGLAQALLHDPPVLILDEPTAGLDPNQIAEFRKLLAELRGQHTIVLSTHILSEIERTADRALIIARGQILFDEKIAHEQRIVLEARASAEAVRRVIAQMNEVAAVEVSARDGWSRALVTPKAGGDLRDQLGQLALSNHWPVRELSHETASLEKHFAQVTSGGATLQHAAG